MEKSRPTPKGTRELAPEKLLSRHNLSRNKQLFLIEPPPKNPKLFEEKLFAEGYLRIAGVDEVGRGCLAGPVVAAAVILKWDTIFLGLKDSKQLTKEQREYFYPLIVARATAFGVGVVEALEIDRVNILQASLKAMVIAVRSLSVAPDYLLVDGRDPVPIAIPQKAIPKGDDLSYSIAAASVVAKVTRDRMMVECEKKFPQFGFSVHKGYGTRRHWEELAISGASPIHRLTFRGVAKAYRHLKNT